MNQEKTEEIESVFNCHTTLAGSSWPRLFMSIEVPFSVRFLPSLKGPGVSSQYASKTYNRLRAGCYRTQNRFSKSIYSTA